jgi:mono/diheme cytochrome c family protein
MKKFLVSLVLLVVVVALVLAYVTRTSPGLQGDVGNDPALVGRGQYLARVADCAACHTAIGGKVYAGGLKIASPVGTIYSTNITPDKATGIGGYSLADFDRAVRQGVRKDGASLYPAMPYPSFARMTDADIKALYAYFQHGVAAVDAPNKAEGIRWPLSMRWPLALWRGVFAPAVTPMQPPASGDPQVARGEYLVTGPGHCGACHTPRGSAMQEQALDDRKGGAAFLAGGTVIDNWYVPGLRGDDAQGLGRWSEEDIVDFLKTGRTDRSAVFGGMADVVAWSTQYFTDDDLRAVAKYLKTLPPAQAGKAGYVYDGSTKAWLDGGRLDGHPGALVYQQECALCHRNDGKGVARMFPPLAGNPVVLSDDPISLVHLIVQGGALPPSNWAPSTVAMPAYAERLSDQQIADVTNFIRGAWGNKAAANVTAAGVAAARRGDTSSSGGDTASWNVMPPQPYGEGWTFSPQTHAGADAAQ